jgi:hypothetical protein
MSWNTTFISINREYSGAIDQLQADLEINLGAAAEIISFEEATSAQADGKSVGIGGGWTIICDSSMFFEPDEIEPPAPNTMWFPKFEKGLETCSVESRILGFIVSGVSGTYGMTLHENGALRRCRLIQEGNTLIDSGEPLPEEIEIVTAQTDEEDRVFILLKKFGLAVEDLQKIKFTRYQPANV